LAAGVPVTARQASGAGDSLAAAVIYGYLHGLGLEPLGDLANATGAAKVLKLGTGHNLPTVAEVNAMLERFGSEVRVPPPAAAPADSDQ
jgi:sugar/nucleoside kinase (ribokinase family)